MAARRALAAAAGVVFLLVALTPARGQWLEIHGTAAFVGFEPAIGLQLLLPQHIDLDLSLCVTLGEGFALGVSGKSLSYPYLSISRIEIGAGFRF